MTDRQLYILDQYHLGQLSADEKAEFDVFKQDPAFMEQIKFLDQLRPALVKKQEIEFRAKLDKWDREAVAVRSRRNMLVGLLILLGLAIGVYFGRSYFGSGQSDAEDMYMAYAAPYKNIYLPLARSQADESAEEKAMRAYERGAYDEALLLFKEQTINQADESVVFYTAVSQLLSDLDDDAQANFNRLLDSEKYAIPSRWYVMLLSLKNEDRQVTRRHLSMLIAQTAYPKIAKEAKAIQDRLDIK